jgi:hypothetical protein
MSNQSIIEHRANMYYVEFREEYLALALACTYKKPTGKSKASPYCKALILAIAEGWTNSKRGCKDLTFYMTYEQWGESMYGMFSRPVIIDSVSELVGETLLSREIFRVGGKDTFRYLFNHTEVNVRLKSLEAKEPNVTRQLIDAETGKKVDGLKSLLVTGKKVYPDASINLPNIESTQHLSTEHKETYDADASLPHVFSDDELLALLQERGYSITNQPELSTPDTANVEKSSVDPLATCNPIATDTPQPPQNENGSQSELIARPEKPEMPPTSMKLSAEKIVQITEALRGKYYPPEQRAKNKAAAVKIIAKNVNEEQYITAYQDRNDEWWKSTKGPLHVVHMAGKTTNGEMRVLEVLEQVQERISAKVVQFPGRARSGPVDSSYHPELETDADRATRDAKNQANLDKLTRRIEAKEQREREEQAKLRERRAN